MAKENKASEGIKNMLDQSSIAAGGNVQIGDVHIHHHQDVQGKNIVKISTPVKIILSFLALIAASFSVYKFSQTNDLQPSISTKPEMPKVNDTIVNPKQSTQKKQEPKAPHAIRKYVNNLEVTTTSKEYNRLFTSKMGEMLRSVNLKYQQNSNGNVVNRIKCNFELKKSKTNPSGIEAFKYSLSLQIEVIGQSGQTCFSQHYSSREPRIGYLDESEDELSDKVVEPLLSEIKTDFLQQPPTLCEVQ